MYIMFCRNEFRKTQSHHHGLTHSPHIWRTIIYIELDSNFAIVPIAMRGEQTMCLPSSRSHTEIPQCCILRCIRASLPLVAPPKRSVVGWFRPPDKEFRLKLLLPTFVGAANISIAVCMSPCSPDSIFLKHHNSDTRSNV